MSETCLWCGKPAVAFCDAWIGGEAVFEGGVYRFSIRGENFLCDAPMCNEHRKVFGFMCGEDPDTIDRCPVHQNDRVTFANAAKTKAEAESARRAVWAIGRRAALHTI